MQLDRAKLKDSSKKSLNSLIGSLPATFSVILLIGLVNTMLSKEMITRAFSGSSFLDGVIGSSIGSILAGNPVSSYIISGELAKNGVGLFAITAFLVSWVTVGVVQLPAESILLGRRFAIARNITAFFFSLAVAGIVVFLMEVL